MMISFGLFAVVKVLVSILVVVLLSLIAEHAGPRVAGIVSGYPLGAAISLFFIGIEIDPAFAARGAIFTAAGLSATVAFVGGYLLGLKAAEERRRMPALLLALLPATFRISTCSLQSKPRSWQRHRRSITPSCSDAARACHA